MSQLLGRQGRQQEYLSKLIFAHTRLLGRQGRPSLDICPNFLFVKTPSMGKLLACSQDSKMSCPRAHRLVTSQTMNVEIFRKTHKDLKIFSCLVQKSLNHNICSQSCQETQKSPAEKKLRETIISNHTISIHLNNTDKLS